MRLLIAIFTIFLAFTSDAFAATLYKTETIDGVKIFYREAGDASLPTMVLLHGYPTSSHMYRDLIPLLVKNFHVIAPDYPGFGYSDSPTPKQFTYGFDNYAWAMSVLLKKIGVKNYYLYLQDYGGPVGFRMAAAYPDKIRGLGSRLIDYSQKIMMAAMVITARKVWACR